MALTTVMFLKIMWEGWSTDTVFMFPPDKEVALTCPKRPELTPCDFFLWGYVKDTDYWPRLPHDLQVLRRLIMVTATEKDLLEKVWQEFDYQLDVCRLTRVPI
jgi:hypothetical protein